MSGEAKLQLIMLGILMAIVFPVAMQWSMKDENREWARELMWAALECIFCIPVGMYWAIKGMRKSIKHNAFSLEGKDFTRK